MVSSKNRSGRYAYDGLDRLLHEKARLGIMTSLFSNPEGLIFTQLKELCALTDGNLSRHLKVLKDAGLLEIWKGFNQNKPQTLCKLTEDGRTRFVDYLNELEQVIKDAAAIKKKSKSMGEMEPGYQPG